VFASGSGTNLQALLDRFAGDDATARVVLVVSDRADARALSRGSHAGARTEVVPVAGRPVDEVATDLLALLAAERIELIALAGYLRLVPPAVVARFAGRIVNIHPALLPAFGGNGMYGARVHRAVLASGCLVTGVTVHMVSERYDEGAALAQWPVPVHSGDTVESLAARVLALEHMIYPLAIERLARSLTGDAEGELTAPMSFAASNAGTPPSADVARLVRAPLAAGARPPDLT
jgi:formyltetrahydrofolate-dependent phosphoribosylglycinamide formyltransferase